MILVTTLLLLVTGAFGEVQPVTATSNAIPAGKGKRIECSKAGIYFLLSPVWVEAG
jgi:hypothetical protein